jgi:hypothetical protein
MCHKLLAIANPEHGWTGRKYCRINSWTSGFVHAGRPTGNDHAAAAAQLFSRGLARKNLGIHTEFTDLASNEVSVLSAGIEYGDLGVGDVVGHLG